MSSASLVGVVLIITALIDVVLGFFFIGPRIADDSRRRMIQVALVVGAAIMLGLGVAFLSGVFTPGLN